MANHYRDRNLVKNPKPVRFDTYQQKFIEAAADWQGTNFSDMVRQLCEEAIDARLSAMLANEHNKQKESI